MFNIKKILLFGFVALSLFACGGKKQSKQAPISINLTDAVTQQIFNIRSKRNAQGDANTEALKTFLAVENPTHRYMAALSLASIQDSSAIEVLGDALQDPYVDVRRVAAFALGQTQSSAAAKLLSKAFQTDSVRVVQALILEAVGRCGTESELKSLCVAHPYPIQDSLLQEGLALALYRFALRKMVQTEGTDRIMNDFISNEVMPAKARFTAANYLARIPDIDLTQYATVLINNVQKEKDPNILMFLVLGLAKTKNLDALKVLEKTFYRQDDYRVRCQIIRGLNHFPYDSSRALVSNALYDTSLHVRVTAADYLISFGTARDALTYFEWAEKHPHWLVRTRLIAAAMKNLEHYKGQSKAFLSTKLTERFNKCDNDYEKSEILQALSHFSWNHRFIADAIFPKSDTIKLSPVVRSGAAAALVSLYSSPLLEKEMNFSTPRIKEEIHQIFRRCIESGDVGVIATVAEAIANEKNNMRIAFPEYGFLKAAQNKLTLPRDIETYKYLQNAIDYLSGAKTPTVVKPKGNFVEIDWHFINALGPNPKVAISTNKGRIVLELYPQHAPATVMQFVHLVKAGYYNNKHFHRVVPNFVVQGGCPRGDGWGGFDVNVVSEFSMLRYTEAGRVGMASAGKDTESAQFFITHAPAIHLDGRYTIFAQVVEGMDIVHLLEIGDLMQKVELLR
jgi:cyclophilin family peptidyl-prolyl cis-trans isomerase/HEAT repeat protein